METCFVVIMNKLVKICANMAMTAGGVWPDELVDESVEVFASEADNRAQRRAKKAEREKAAAKG